MNDIELIDEIVKRADKYQKQKEKDFAIVELEKLKAEMLEAQKPYYCLSDTEYCKIIDKRIAELKGENNGNS